MLKTLLNAVIAFLRQIINKRELIEHKEYSKEGVLLIDGYYDKNKRKTGVWHEYYNNSVLAIEFHYENGLMHGSYRSYYETGSIWCTGTYVNGKKEGVYTIYNKEGKIFLIHVYNNDKILKEQFVEKNMKK